jgi:hypothetical protein
MQNYHLSGDLFLFFCQVILLSWRKQHPCKSRAQVCGLCVEIVEGANVMAV